MITTLVALHLLLEGAKREGRLERFAGSLSAKQARYVDVAPHCFVWSLSAEQWALLAGHQKTGD